MSKLYGDICKTFFIYLTLFMATCHKSLAAVYSRNSSSDCWLSNKSFLMAAISVDSWIPNPTQFRPSSQNFSLHHNDRILRCRIWPESMRSLTPADTAKTVYNYILFIVIVYCLLILFSNNSVRPSVRPSVSQSVSQSVCLSVRHTLVLYLNDCWYRQTFTTVWDGMSSFLT